MNTPLNNSSARTRVAQKLNELYAPLVELVDALQALEPGGTLIDEVRVTASNGEEIWLSYAPEPLMLRIKTVHRTLILRAMEGAAN